MHRARVLLVLLAGCGASPAPQPAPPAKAPPPTATQPAPAITLPTPPPSFRLPTTVRPTHNTVALAVDPGSEDFTGTITTELAIAEPMSTIWLNGDEIDVDTATIDQAGTSQSASVAKDGKDLIGISVPHPLAAGAATMTIKYRGKVHVGDGDGIYRYQEGGDWYAVTQFEIADARQAFPTFDEPSFKVPWQLTLTIKASLTAVSNTPSTSDHDNGDGTRTVTFAETRPLPSYLVAFAVGPFELVDAGKTARGVPVRIVVPRGRARDAAYPVKVSAELLDHLEAYFGTPYPYPKLDLVAIAVLDHGAMENAGMITFNEPLVLTPPAELTRGRQESYASVATHEMAHQWFGDLVTLAWWDDTWLNESFAQWMEVKIVDAWKPEWELGVGKVATKSDVMGQDSLDSARAIYQPIKNRGDILNAFDGITYQKGEAVLTMIERHLGEGVFRTGVHDYLVKHAFGNATYDDFVASMSSAAGRDVRPLFDSFVKQSGIPYVSATLSCAPNQPPRLALAQARYAPVGSQMTAGDRARTWTIPMCVEWSAGGPGPGHVGRDCTVLDQPTGELALSAKTCPAWVLPNEGELAYYRPRLAGADLDHLLAHTHELTVAERVGLVGDVAALVQSGDASNAVALGLVADLARDQSRHIVDASIGIVAGIDEMVPDELRANYERLIGKLYKARAHDLGWAAKPGEDADRKQLRPTLLGLVAGKGKDRPLIDEATRLVWKWFDDHAAIQPELVTTALETAARYGNQALFDKLHAVAKAEKDRGEQERLVAALGAFEDPKLLDQKLGILLADDFDFRQTFGMLFANLAAPKLRAPTFVWVKQHFDEVSAKLPKDYKPFMAFVAAPLCDEAMKPEVAAFLKPRIEPLDGGPRVLAQALEQLSLCAAKKAAQTPGVVEFLKRQ